VLYGGGVPELIMARAVEQQAARTPGKKALAMESFAKALRSIPGTICDNAGLDSADLISRLRALHAEDHNARWGVNVQNGAIEDMRELGVYESFRVKQQTLNAATEAAEMITRVDSVLKSAPKQSQE
jgi:T-complex protein 1 subunit beta